PDPARRPRHRAAEGRAGRAQGDRGGRALTMRIRLALVLAALVVTLLTAVTFVGPGEVAVVRRFGRILDDRPGPGLFLGLPWGMDQVDRVPVGRVKRVVVGLENKDDEEQSDTPAGQLLTGDHNLVNVQAEINYTVFEAQVDTYVL